MKPAPSLTQAELRQAQLSGLSAEARGHWHVAVKHYFDCFYAAEANQDAHATRFFAAKLGTLYQMMGMANKADYYALLGESC